MPENMTPYDPIKVNRRIIVGTDHLWTIRRVATDGVIFIPESAKAQIRSSDRKTLWLELDLSIDPVDGWITITIPEASTVTDPKWNSRTKGVWDMEVVYNGKKTRWVYGTVCVSEDATK